MVPAVMPVAYSVRSSALVVVTAEVAILPAAEVDQFEAEPEDQVPVAMVEVVDAPSISHQ
jgi:hypothetical protein